MTSNTLLKQGWLGVLLLACYLASSPVRAVTTPVFLNSPASPGNPAFYQPTVLNGIAHFMG